MPYLDPEGALTPLEHDLLDNFHSRYKQNGFPAPQDIIVKSRDKSSAGSYTYLDHDGYVELPDDTLGLGTISQIDMDGLRNGASFQVLIKSGKVLYLDIAVNGNYPWPETESRWSILDPETGERVD
jgi:hypothetical protein